MNYQPKSNYNFSPTLLKDIDKSPVKPIPVEVYKPITSKTLNRRVKKMQGQYEKLLRIDPDLKRFNQCNITVEADMIRINMNGTKKPGEVSHMEKEVPIHDSLNEIKRIAERIRRNQNK